MQRVEWLEHELRAAPVRDRQLAGYAAVFIALTGIGAGIAFWRSYGLEPEKLFEFASYVLAALAAVVVGLGLFFRRERTWFWWSAALVVFGMFTFFASFGPLKTPVYLLISLNAIASGILLVPVYLIRTAAEHVPRSKAFIAASLFVSVAGLSCGTYLLKEYFRAPAQVPSHPFECHRAGQEAGTGRSILVCDN